MNWNILANVHTNIRILCVYIIIHIYICLTIMLNYNRLRRTLGLTSLLRAGKFFT